MPVSCTSSLLQTQRFLPVHRRACSWSSRRICCRGSGQCWLLVNWGFPCQFGWRDLPLLTILLILRILLGVWVSRVFLLFSRRNWCWRCRWMCACLRIWGSRNSWSFPIRRWCGSLFFALVRGSVRCSSWRDERGIRGWRVRESVSRREYLSTQLQSLSRLAFTACLPK